MSFWTTLTVKKSPYKSTGYKVVKVVKVENPFILNSIKCILMRINVEFDFHKIENKAFSTLTTLTR